MISKLIDWLTHRELRKRRNQALRDYGEALSDVARNSDGLSGADALKLLQSASVVNLADRRSGHRKEHRPSP